MKIIQNIPGFAKLIFGLNFFYKYSKNIDAARAKGDFEEERKYILASTVTWSQKLKEYFNINMEIEGQENIPDKGPVVIMSNHQGNADILAMLVAFRKFQIGFVAKDELHKIPLYGKCIEQIRSVFIERDDARASLEAINKGISYIKDGFSLVIFPEGTRAQCSTPNKFMKGPVKLATKPGVPIIPVSIEGSYKVFEENGYIKPATIKMIIHEPIETAGMGRAEEKELSEKVEKIIVDGVHKLANSN